MEWNDGSDVLLCSGLLFIEISSELAGYFSGSFPPSPFLKIWQNFKFWPTRLFLFDRGNLRLEWPHTFLTLPVIDWIELVYPQPPHSTWEKACLSAVSLALLVSDSCNRNLEGSSWSQTLFTQLSAGRHHSPQRQTVAVCLFLTFSTKCNQAEAEVPAGFWFPLKELKPAASLDPPSFGLFWCSPQGDAPRCVLLTSLLAP